MSAPRTIYIAGAGVAGLTLALALAKFSLRVVVVEKNTAISAFGAGLQIGPNARRELDRLGLGQAMSAASFAPDGLDIYAGRKPDPVQTLQLGTAIHERFGAAYSVMHRADLVEELYTAVKRFANVEIVFGVEVFSVRPEGDGVAVSFVEPDGKTRNAKAFAFIGADGVNSPTRQTVLGGPEAEYSGTVAWRALLTPDALPDSLRSDHTSLFLGSGSHGVIYPLPYRDCVNAVLFTPIRKPLLSRLEEVPTPPIPRRTHPALRAIVDAAEGKWTSWVLNTVSPPAWGTGPIGLIGDAAHAMLPFQAQGAAMAIEDAATLAPLLAASPTASHAIARLAALRTERIAKVQAVSEKNGRIFHMRWPFALARNAVIRFEGPQGHFRRLDWLYGFDTQYTQT